jgi:hypothetical protein
MDGQRIPSTEANHRADESANVVPRWVRIGSFVTVGLPNVVTGLWAVVAPRHWFDHFPGFGPLLVAAEPPFNAHLATDAGVGFLALGLAVVVAALLARSHLLAGALAISFVGAVPHLAYHLLNPAPGLTDAENAMSSMSLAFGVVLLAVFAWGALRRRDGQHFRQMPDMQAKSPGTRSG